MPIIPIIQIIQIIPIIPITQIMQIIQIKHIIQIRLIMSILRNIKLSEYKNQKLEHKLQNTTKQHIQNTNNTTTTISENTFYRRQYFQTCSNYSNTDIQRNPNTGITQIPTRYRLHKLQNLHKIQSQTQKHKTYQNTKMQKCNNSLIPN